jgi:hypothetical protein
MAGKRREDDERHLPENHIYLTLPGVNKPVVIFFPADKYTCLVIIAMLCATLVLGVWLIFVKGDQENVAGVFGNKPPVATARAIAPAALCPCERPRQESNLHVTDLESAPQPPGTRAEALEEPSRTKVKASAAEGKRQPTAKRPTARSQGDGRQVISKIRLPEH